MDTTTRVLPGRYRHFKGGIYIVLGVARHVDSPQEFVVYRSMEGEGSLFVRSTDDFRNVVELHGERCPRFEYLGPEVDHPAEIHELAGR